MQLTACNQFRKCTVHYRVWQPVVHRKQTLIYISGYVLLFLDNKLAGTHTPKAKISFSAIKTYYIFLMGMFRSGITKNNLPVKNLSTLAVMI